MATSSPPRPTMPTISARRWELVGGRVAIPAGARTARFRFTAVRNSGPTNDSYLDGAFVYVQADAIALDQGAYGGASACRAASARRRSCGSSAPICTRTGSTPCPCRSAGSRWAIRTTCRCASTSTRMAPTDRNSCSTSLPPRRTRANTTGSPPTAASVTARTACASRSRWSAFPTSSTAAPRTSRSPRTRTPSTSTMPAPSATCTRRRSAAIATTAGFPREPMPYPNNVLRTYTLAPTDTLYVDTGNYPLLSPHCPVGHPRNRRRPRLHLHRARATDWPPCSRSPIRSPSPR